jgi:anti-anti-sigma regulatory factor
MMADVLRILDHTRIVDAYPRLSAYKRRCEARGSRLILVEVQPEPTEHLKKYGLEDLISISNEHLR